SLTVTRETTQGKRGATRADLARAVSDATLHLAGGSTLQLGSHRGKSTQEFFLLFLHFPL
ncbi:unnamed protein product, partial [Pylaiella littoralis]